MEDFDLDFDMDAFEQEHENLVAEDAQLRDLIGVARQRMAAPIYADAQGKARIAQKGIALHLDSIEEAGGQDAWRKKLASGGTLAKAEGEASAYFDAFDQARSVLEQPQGAVRHRVAILEADRNRAAWVAANPDAHSAEQAALDQIRADHIAALSPGGRLTLTAEEWAARNPEAAMAEEIALERSARNYQELVAEAAAERAAEDREG